MVGIFGDRQLITQLTCAVSIVESYCLRAIAYDVFVFSEIVQ